MTGSAYLYLADRNCTLRNLCQKQRLFLRRPYMSFCWTKSGTLHWRPLLPLACCNPIIETTHYNSFEGRASLNSSGYSRILQAKRNGLTRMQSHQGSSSNNGRQETCLNTAYKPGVIVSHRGWQTAFSCQSQCTFIHLINCGHSSLWIDNKVRWQMDTCNYLAANTLLFCPQMTGCCWSLTHTWK